MKLNAIQNHNHLAHFLLENVVYTVRNIEYRKRRNKSRLVSNRTYRLLSCD